MSERKHWIDLTKAICMLGVYLIHSQIYTNSMDYGALVYPFYVNAFFFCSGYLFFYSKMSDDGLIKINKRGG